MKKKLAIVFFGMSHGTNHHWTGNTYLVDWRNSLENYKKYLFNYFSETFDIDVYGSTYHHNLIPILKLSLNIKELGISTFRPSRIISRNWCLIDALKLLLKSNVEYDQVLITRYDLHFNIPFSVVRINYNKINMVSFLEKENLICDNFYLFPYHLLQPLYDTMYEYGRNQSYHCIYKEFVKFAPINMLYNQRRKVEDLDFYSIVRQHKGIWTSKGEDATHIVEISPST